MRELREQLLKMAAEGADEEMETSLRLDDLDGAMRERADEWDRTGVQTQVPSSQSWLDGFSEQLDALGSDAGSLAFQSSQLRGTIRTGTPGPAVPVVGGIPGGTISLTFKNSHPGPMWLVICEEGMDGEVEFTPSDDLASAPEIPEGGAYTLEFVSNKEAMIPVVALGFSRKPSGSPDLVLSDPDALKELGVVSNVKFLVQIRRS